MIYFMAPEEGAKFIRIIRQADIPISKLIHSYVEQNLECICVFENGTVYDGVLPKHGLSPIRNSFGSQEGTELYKSLMDLDLPEETII